MTIIRRGAKFGVKAWDPHLRRQVWVGTFDSEREAKRAERDAELELGERPEKRPGEVETCERFAERWRADYCQGLEASTLKAYEAPVRLFARHFHGRPLDSISRPEARAWSLEQSRNTQNVVRTMLNHALRDGLITSNPFADLRLKQSRGRKDILVLSPAELAELADDALRVFPDYGPTFRAMILFAAYTGVRPGELFDLEWEPRRHEDGTPASWVDLDAQEVHVNGQIRPDGRVSYTKNKRTRTVILAPVARDALAATQRLQGVPALFTTRMGKRFSRATLANTWSPVRALAARPAMDFYELRHFCATYLLERGLTPSDVAVQLGHTDNGALVMSTYGHPSESAARRRILEALLRAA